MPKPTFTPKELYLINSLKSNENSSNYYMWNYLTVGFIMAALGAQQGNYVLMWCALAIIAGYRIYEERHQKKYEHVWRSIIDKYESALSTEST
jgi:hypothetical protein